MLDYLLTCIYMVYITRRPCFWLFNALEFCWCGSLDPLSNSQRNTFDGLASVAGSNFCRKPDLLFYRGNFFYSNWNWLDRSRSDVYCRWYPEDMPTERCMWELCRAVGKFWVTFKNTTDMTLAFKVGYVTSGQTGKIGGSGLCLHWKRFMSSAEVKPWGKK